MEVSYIYKYIRILLILLINFSFVLVYQNTNFDELFVEDSTFENNTSVIGGGAINAETLGTINIVKSKFIRNKSLGQGGCFDVKLVEHFTIEDTYFEENQAKSLGGVIHIQSVGNLT